MAPACLIACGDILFKITMLPNRQLMYFIACYLLLLLPPSCALVEVAPTSFIYIYIDTYIYIYVYTYIYIINSISNFALGSSYLGFK